MKQNKTWTFTPLSNQQKARLSILAKQAWMLAQKRGAIEDGVTFDQWRYDQQKEACSVASLRDADQSHFLPLRGKWFVILGNLELAFYDMLNAGDLPEKTRQMKWRLIGFVAILADGIQAEKARIKVMVEADQAAKEAWNYTLALAKDKYSGRRVESLGPDELQQLCHTVVNRANAKLGKGSAETRNKSQRRKAAAGGLSANAKPLESVSRRAGIDEREHPAPEWGNSAARRS